MDPAVVTGAVAIVAALAGAATGAIAAHLLGGRIRAEEREQLRERAEGRVSINAYALQRQVAAWLAAWPRDGREQLSWIQEVTSAGEFEKAEARAQSIVAESLNASNETVRVAQETIVFFYSATEVLHRARSEAEISVTKQDDYGDILEAHLRAPWDARVEEALRQLHSCGAGLDQLLHPRLRRLRTALASIASLRVHSGTDPQAQD